MPRLAFKSFYIVNYTGNKWTFHLIWFSYTWEKNKRQALKLCRCEPSNVFYFQDVGFLLNRESWWDRYFLMIWNALTYFSFSGWWRSSARASPWRTWPSPVAMSPSRPTPSSSARPRHCWGQSWPRPRARSKPSTSWTWTPFTCSSCCSTCTGQWQQYIDH